MRKCAMALVAVLVAAGTAAADKSSWCPKDYKDLGESEVNDALAPMDIGDPDRKLAYLAQTLCSSSSAVTAKNAELNARHEKIGKLFGLKGADWADALDLDQPGAPTPLDIPSDMPPDQYSSKDLAQITPVEQYIAISSRSAFQDANQHPLGSPIYFTDALGSHLSELGRAAFINWCFSGISKSSDLTVTMQAICQEDFDKFDPAKAFADIRAAQISPREKMAFRQVVAILTSSIPNVDPVTESFIKKDDEYKRVLDVAAVARADWEKTLGTRTDLLDLALKTESAFVFHSRKMADGCEDATTKALHDAVSAIPAKTFKGAHDVNGPKSGAKTFGAQVADIFVKNKDMYLVAVSYFACRPDNDIGRYLAAVYGSIAGFRGPRTAAATALLAEIFKFDDVNKTSLSTPGENFAKGILERRSTNSVGGVVREIQPDKNPPPGLTVKVMEVDLVLGKITEEACVQEHRGNHILRVNNDGAIQYDMVCDRWGMRTFDAEGYDRTDLSVESAKLLKPGMMFSAYGVELIATWPNKNAKLPSMLFGVHVK